MKGVHLFFLSLLVLGFAGCKTQEDIRRERTVENLNEKIEQTQKSTAGTSSRFLALEEQISRLQGQMEELNHQKGEAIKENQNLGKRIQTLEETSKSQVDYIKALTEKVNNQSDYIEEVIASLEKLSQKSEEEKPAKKKAVKEDSKQESEEITFKNGYNRYQEKDYDAAREIFQAVLENKKAKKKDREGATHYLGMIAYKNKNYEEAKVHFSKLFSDNPKSNFAPQTLLSLAKTFKELKSKEEAGFTLDELIERFPESKEAGEAKKLKAKI